MKCLHLLISHSRLVGVSQNSEATAVKEREGHSSASASAARPQLPTLLPTLQRLVAGSLSAWPTSFSAKTPKEVLFVDELEGLLGVALPDECLGVEGAVLVRTLE